MALQIAGAIGGDAGFANSRGEGSALDKVDVCFPRVLAYPGDSIVVEIVLFNAPIGGGDLPEQGYARSKNGRAFELGFDSVGVDDLARSRCINFRHGSAGVYRGEFEKGRKSISVAVSGPLIVDDLELVIAAALDGVGLAYRSEEHGAEHLASGALSKVLEDWCQPYPGFFLYYPSRRNQAAA